MIRLPSTPSSSAGRRARDNRSHVGRPWQTKLDASGVNQNRSVDALAGPWGVWTLNCGNGSCRHKHTHQRSSFRASRGHGQRRAITRVASDRCRRPRTQFGRPPPPCCAASRASYDNPSRRTRTAASASLLGGRLSIVCASARDVNEFRGIERTTVTHRASAAVLEAGSGVFFSRPRVRSSWPRDCHRAGGRPPR